VHFDAADELGYPTPTESAAVEEFAARFWPICGSRTPSSKRPGLPGTGRGNIGGTCASPIRCTSCSRVRAQPELFRAFDYDIALDADWEVLDRFSPGHE